MKKMILLLVSVFFMTGSAFAQDNGTNSSWSRNRAIRSTRNYANGGWSYRPNGPSRDRHYTVPSWRGIGPGIQNNTFFNSNFGNHGYWGRGGQWVPVAVAGIDAGAGILINNKSQNTVRDANNKDYELEMKRLEMQEARELREFKARQEQAQWEREQEEQVSYGQPQPQSRSQQSFESPVSYQLSVSRSYVVENQSSCAINIKQGDVLKADSLGSGTYQTIYFEKEDGALRLQGLGCKLSHSFVGNRIVVSNGR